jgi:hypothetical protein
MHHDVLQLNTMSTAATLSALPKADVLKQFIAPACRAGRAAAAPSPPPPSGGSAGSMQVLASGASATAAAAADAGASVTKRAGSISAMQPLPAILVEPVVKRKSLPPLPHHQVSPFNRGKLL